MARIVAKLERTRSEYDRRYDGDELLDFAENLMDELAEVWQDED